MNRAVQRQTSFVVTRFERCNKHKRRMPLPREECEQRLGKDQANMLFSDTLHNVVATNFVRSCLNET